MQRKREEITIKKENEKALCHSHCQVRSVDENMTVFPSYKYLIHKSICGINAKDADTKNIF